MPANKAGTYSLMCVLFSYTRAAGGAEIYFFGQKVLDSFGMGRENYQQSTDSEATVNMRDTERIIAAGKVLAESMDFEEMESVTWRKVRDNSFVICFYYFIDEMYYI